MKKNLAVLYGGVTTEHEVSIVTAVQLMENVNLDRYHLTPVYLDKKGQWWTGEKLLDIHYYQEADLFKPQGLEPFQLIPQPGANQIDVAILCFHGGQGEGGGAQGLLELAQIPYQGPGVLGSALAYDKVATRQILTAAGISQADYIWFNAYDWQENSAAQIERINQLQYPLFVKPSRSGSSIGLQKVTEPTELAKTVDEVFQFDSRIIIESQINDCLEVNVSVLGGDKLQASPAEQPIKTDQFLSFADKYEKGEGKKGGKGGMASASRKIPAPISPQLAEKLQALAKKIFRLFDCSGVVRIDFFVNPSTEEIYVTELNTIPGSMSYYLWEVFGLEYPALIDRLVEIAENQASNKKEIITSFESNILEKQG